MNLEDTQKQSEFLGNIQNLMDDETVEIDKIAAVINADAVDMAKKGSEAAEFIEEFIDKGVEINVCSNSIQNRGIDEEDLVEGVNIVSSGVGKLNKLQDKGFNYIKV